MARFLAILFAASTLASAHGQSADTSLPGQPRQLEPLPFLAVNEGSATVAPASAPVPAPPLVSQSPDRIPQGVRPGGRPRKPADRPAQRSIAADQEQLVRLQAALNDPRQEYVQAEAGFTRADSQLKQKQRALQALQSEGKADRARS